MFLADSQIIATWVDMVEIQYGSAFVLSAFSRQTEMFRKRAREYLIGRNMAHSCYYIQYILQKSEKHIKPLRVCEGSIQGIQIVDGFP